MRNCDMGKAMKSALVTTVVGAGLVLFLGNRLSNNHPKLLEQEVQVEEPNKSVGFGVFNPNPVPNEASNSVSQTVDYNVDDFLKPAYSQEDKTLMTNILYSEASICSEQERKLVARTILNRVRRDEYPVDISNVIFEKRAFPSIGSNNWKQATGKLERNAYDEKIYRRCNDDVKFILEGNKIGVPYEDEIVAYHDDSVDYKDLVAKELKLKKKWKKKGKRYEGYWINLKPVCKTSHFTFYRNE